MLLTQCRVGKQQGAASPHEYHRVSLLPAVEGVQLFGNKSRCEVQADLDFQVILLLQPLECSDEGTPSSQRDFKIVLTWVFLMINEAGIFPCALVIVRPLEKCVFKPSVSIGQSLATMGWKVASPLPGGLWLENVSSVHSRTHLRLCESALAGTHSGLVQGPG